MDFSSDSDDSFTEKRGLTADQKKKMADGRAKKKAEKVMESLKEIEDDKKLREKEIERLNKKSEALHKKHGEEVADLKKKRKELEAELAEISKLMEKSEKKLYDALGKLSEEMDPHLEKMDKLEKEEKKLKKSLADATKSIAPAEDLPKKTTKKSTKKVDVSDDSDTGSETSSGKKTKKSIPKAVKTLVWNRYIGEDNAKGKCCCCEATEIRNTHFHCGHVIAESKGGTLEITNLRPICAECNLSMESRNMHEFKKTFGLGGRKNKDE